MSNPIAYTATVRFIDDTVEQFHGAEVEIGEDGVLAVEVSDGYFVFPASNVKFYSITDNEKLKEIKDDQEAQDIGNQASSVDLTEEETGHVDGSAFDKR